MALHTNTSVLFSFPPLYAYASVSMPPSRTASGVIFVAWGKGKDGIRNSNFLSKNLHALSGVVFCLKNLLILLPNLWGSSRDENDQCGRKTSQENIRHTERRKEKETAHSKSEQDNQQSRNRKI